MDSISNNPAPVSNPAPGVPATTTDPSAPAGQAAPSAQTGATQQVPQTGTLPTSADQHFDFPQLTAPRTGDLSPASLLQSLAISLEKTDFSIIKEEYRNHIAAAKIYADAEAAVRNLPAEAKRRVGEADKMIDDFASQIPRNQIGAPVDEDGAQMLSAMNDPEGLRNMRLVAMAVEGVELSDADRNQILGTAALDGEIPVQLIGQLAGPGAESAAERAVEGMLRGSVTDQELFFAGPKELINLIDGGNLRNHPAKVRLREMDIPSGPDMMLGKILSAIYRSNERNADSDDVLDQMAATVDVLAQRFAGKIEVDENIGLDFRNKMSI